MIIQVSGTKNAWCDALGEWSRKKQRKTQRIPFLYRTSFSSSISVASRSLLQAVKRNISLHGWVINGHGPWSTLVALFGRLVPMNITVEELDEDVAEVVPSYVGSIQESSGQEYKIYEYKINILAGLVQYGLYIGYGSSYTSGFLRKPTRRKDCWWRKKSDRPSSGVSRLYKKGNFMRTFSWFSTLSRCRVIPHCLRFSLFWTTTIL